MRCNLRLGVALIAVASLCACSDAARTVPADDRAAVEEILRAMDSTTMSPEEKVALYRADAVILAPSQPAIRGHDALLAHLREATLPEGVRIEHYAREVERQGDVVVTEGGVRGEWRETPEAEPVMFATHNVIVYKRDADGALKVWKVIYNDAPAE